MKFNSNTTPTKGKRKRDEDADSTKQPESVGDSTDDDDVIWPDTQFTTFVTLRIKFSSDNDFLKVLRDKYHNFLSTLQLADPTAHILPANPSRTDLNPIYQADSLPSRMTGLSPYFQSTSRSNRKGAFAYWVNARLSHDIDWEDLAETTNYDLNDLHIQLMQKRVQCYKTSTPAYFLFVNNQSDPLQLVSDINMDLPTEFTWTLFNKKPWECTYAPKNKPKENDKSEDKKDTYSKFPHIECDENQTEDLLSALRKWISSGTAKRRFGPHIKLVSCLTNKSPPTQVDRTIRMNNHGRRFQASVGMIELKGLTNPNGVLSKKGATVRDILLKLKTHDDKPVFLSVTRKWNSSQWQATYILQRKQTALDIATCSAAWVRKELHASHYPALQKHYTPEAINEADGATWDADNHRIITPAESRANDEEKEVANISWLVDMSALDTLDETTTIEFNDGNGFNFEEEVSIKTTRVQEDKSVSESATNTPKPASILRSGGTSVTSEMTDHTRLTDLETGMSNLNEQLANITKLLEQNSPSKANAKDGQDP